MKKICFTLFALFFGVTMMTAQIYLEENFDNGIPSTWVQETDATDGGWKAGSAAALSSAFFPIDDNGTGQVMGNNDDECNCNKLSDRIILPAVDLSAASSAILKFNSYFFKLTYGGSTESCFVDVSTDGGASWTVVQELPTGDGWSNNVFVSLDDYVGGQVMVSFRYSDGGGWLYGVALDDISIFTPAIRDLKANTYVGSRFELSGNSIDIAAEIVNLGIEELNSLDFTWTDGTDTYTETIDGLTLAFGESAIVTHPTQFNVADAISYNISVSVANPNGEVEDNLDNNNVDGIVSGVTFIPKKKMFVEEATGTWCTWCPRGAEWMDYMAEFYPDDFVGVAVHNNDPMVLAAYDNGLTSFPGFSGFPSVIVDREVIYDPSDLEEVLPSSLEKIAPVSPEITNAVMTVADMSISISGAVEFVTQLDNIDYRLNMILAESGVTGTGNGYNQINAYSGQADPIPNFGFNYGGAPNPVPASQMVYNHVGRWLSDGWGGAASSVSPSVVAGDVATKTFDGAFNPDWNPFNMEAIILVLDNATGEALNVNAGHVDVICPANIAEIITTTPSPGTEIIGTINFDMDDRSLGFGGYTYTLNTGETADVGTPIEDLANGTYTITVTDKIGCQHEFTTVVDDATGTQDIEALTKISLSPNPASQNARLSATFSESVDLKISVVNSIGQIVDVAQFDGITTLQHNIDVSKMPAGIYLIKLNTNNQVRTQRLVVR